MHVIMCRKCFQWSTCILYMGDAFFVNTYIEYKSACFSHVCNRCYKEELYKLINLTLL